MGFPLLICWHIPIQWNRFQPEMFSLNDHRRSLIRAVSITKMFMKFIIDCSMCFGSLNLRNWMKYLMFVSDELEVEISMVIFKVLIFIWRIYKIQSVSSPYFVSERRNTLNIYVYLLHYECKSNQTTLLALQKIIFYLPCLLQFV